MKQTSGRAHPCVEVLLLFGELAILPSSDKTTLMSWTLAAHGGGRNSLITFRLSNTVQLFFFFFLMNFSAYFCCQVLDTFMYSLRVNFFLRGIIFDSRGVFANVVLWVDIQNLKELDSTTAD